MIGNIRGTFDLSQSLRLVNLFKIIHCIHQMKWEFLRINGISICVWYPHFCWSLIKLKIFDAFVDFFSLTQQNQLFYFFIVYGFFFLLDMKPAKDVFTQRKWNHQRFSILMNFFPLHITKMIMLSWFYTKPVSKFNIALVSWIDIESLSKASWCDFAFS